MYCAAVDRLEVAHDIVIMVYLPELPEDHAPGQNVLMTLQATDGDPPDTPEGHLEYGLSSQPNTEQFILHPSGEQCILIAAKIPQYIPQNKFVCHNTKAVG